MNYAPITLFVFNRLEHTKKTIDALKKNTLAKESALYIFSDGPRKESETVIINELRDYLKTIDGFKEIIIKKSESNKGLADSIIEGVTEVINKHGKVIVLEDDLVTSPYFLEYMNDALSLYENQRKVFHISGYFFPHQKELPETFFVSDACSWSWGTWKDRWEFLEKDAEKLMILLKKKEGAMKKLNLNNSFKNSSTLKANASGKKKTWAIKWYSTIILNDGLCLYPNKSLIKNIGLDGTGENSGNIDLFKINNPENKIEVKPVPIEENQEALQVVIKSHKKLKPSICQRIKNALKF